MDIYSKHNDGFSQVIAKLGVVCPVFTWGNVNWQIVPGSVKMREKLQPGGFSMDSDLLFWTQLAQFKNNSIQDLKNSLLQTAMQYLGDDYKIISVSVAPGGLQAMIEANALNQGA